MRNLVFIGVAVAFACCNVVTAQVTGYENIIDWANLPAVKGQITSHMASSYARDGSNEDWNWYPDYDRQLNELEDNNLPVTLLDVEGAGVLTRYWMPHATANGGRDLKITVDGQYEIYTNTDDFLGGNYSVPGGDQDLFKSPLVQTVAGGQTSYEPITFSSSLKVESVNLRHMSGESGNSSWNRRHYYQLNYQLFDDGTSVTPYTGTLTTDQAQARQQAQAILANTGANPAGSSSTSTVRPVGTQNIAAGESISLVNFLSGESGTIRSLNLQMDGSNDAALSDLRIRIRYDGASENAVDVPVGAFFGSTSLSAPTYKSLPMGTDSTDGFYCHFPMPYRDGVVVEIYNAGSESLSIGGAKVEYESGPIADDMGYFHAVHNVSQPGSGMHSILNIDGVGHYVGNILTLRASDVDGMRKDVLEGDETITIDGGKIILQGTGLEDAYNGGFYYNHVLTIDDDIDDPEFPESYVGAFGGLILMDTVDDLSEGTPDINSNILTASQCRWMIQDLVAFEEGIVIDIENYRSYGDIFESTAFYYAVPEGMTLAMLLGGALVIGRRRRR